MSTILRGAFVFAVAVTSVRCSSNEGHLTTSNSVGHLNALSEPDSLKPHPKSNGAGGFFILNSEAARIWKAKHEQIIEKLCGCERKRHAAFMSDMAFLQTQEGLSDIKSVKNATALMLDRDALAENDFDAALGPRMEVRTKCQDSVLVAFFGTPIVSLPESGFGISNIPVVEKLKKEVWEDEKSYMLNTVMPYLKQQSAQGSLSRD